MSSNFKDLLLKEISNRAKNRDKNRDVKCFRSSRFFLTGLKIET